MICWKEWMFSWSCNYQFDTRFKNTTKSRLDYCLTQSFIGTKRFCFISSLHVVTPIYLIRQHQSVRAKNRRFLGALISHCSFNPFAPISADNFFFPSPARFAKILFIHFFLHGKMCSMRLNWKRRTPTDPHELWLRLAIFQKCCEED